MGKELLDLLEVRTGWALSRRSPGYAVAKRCNPCLSPSEQGLLKGVGAARVVPVINMVDEPRYEALALEAANFFRQ